MKTYTSLSNEKLKATDALHGTRTGTCSLAPHLTCAKQCKGCYGTRLKRFPSVYKRAEERVYETLKRGFVERIVSEIKRLKLTHYRIHTLGDFMNHEHVNKWIRIAKRCPQVTFYAYSKRVKFVKYAFKKYGQPKNLIIRYSLGGNEDNLVDLNTDLHCKVFKGLDELQKAGYTDCGSDDHLSSSPVLIKLGIVYHGALSFEKSNFA